VTLDDGVFTGYRHHHKTGVDPLFPFGFGLSYTDFEYRAIKARTNSGGDIEVQVSVRNPGRVSGTSVVQVYVSPPNTVIKRWPRSLKAFTRVELAPDQQQTLRLQIPRSALNYWDEALHQWQFESGSYGIEAGPSSDPDHLIRCSLIL
jgi:beta-glucosidase